MLKFSVELEWETSVIQISRYPDIQILSSKFIQPTDPNYPHHELRIFAENYPVDKHNEYMLSQIAKPLVTLLAHGKYPTNVQQKDIDTALSRNRSETGGLDFTELTSKKIQELCLQLM